MEYRHVLHLCCKTECSFSGSKVKMQLQGWGPQCLVVLIFMRAIKLFLARQSFVVHNKLVLSRGKENSTELLRVWEKSQWERQNRDINQCQTDRQNMITRETDSWGAFSSGFHTHLILSSNDHNAPPVSTHWPLPLAPVAPKMTKLPLRCVGDRPTVGREQQSGVSTMSHSYNASTELSWNRIWTLNFLLRN